MAWSRDEVDQTVSVYFEMFKRQLRGEEFVKAEYHRDLAARLEKRTQAAVEYKFQNISAVLTEMEYPRMSGYAPQSNYQKLLRVQVAEHLDDDREFQDLLDREATGRPEEVQVPPSPEDILTSPPDEEDSDELPRDSSPYVPKQVDYVERERRNRNLGRSGEEYIVELEKVRLRQEGRPDLAEQVEWVADTRGDGLGYDILSFEGNGKKRYIEVKTTKQGKSLPFYLTTTELELSQETQKQFYVYRLYDFGGEGKPSLYLLNGPVDEICSLVPKSFRAVPSAKETGLDYSE